MKKLPIGNQDITKIINEDLVYVDKTQHIYKLLDGSYYFLARPRRFGKSLLVSTLKEIFLGNKELFKNLWIYDKIEWIEYPVIHIDFSKSGHKVSGLANAINFILDETAAKYGVELNSEFYPNKFSELIDKLSLKAKVVILIDEYDKPLIDFIEDEEKADANREVLRNFFSVLKGNDAKIRFCFLTGITKFSKVSVFSELNNLYDITLSNEFATITGITQTELEHAFADRLTLLPGKLNDTRENILADIKKWYNGYSWNGVDFVYNPFSLLCFFRDSRFDNYWFATGTPTLLIKLAKKQNRELFDPKSLHVHRSLFDKYDLSDLWLLPLLFQTGYLTIKENNPKTGFLQLNYPNFEVEESFLMHLYSGYAEKSPGESSYLLQTLQQNLASNNLPDFIENLKALYAGISYHLIDNKEKYFHSLFYMVMRLLGFFIDCEVETNTGRIDAVIKTDKFIYILEFKMGDAKTAIAQIKTNNYAQKYISESKQIVLFGIGFDAETKNVGTWEIETLN